MANLREKKREQTRSKIQATSLQLFETLGYEKTTMEKIASEAEMGLGTLYNYFPSKAALFFAIIERNVETYVSELEEIVNGEAALNESLRGFFDVYFKSFTVYGKNIWRDLFRESVFRENGGYAKIQEIDQNFINQLYKLFCARTAKAGIVEEEKLSVAAKAVYSLLGYHIIYYISDTPVTLDEVKESLMEQASLILAGLSSQE